MLKIVWEVQSRAGTYAAKFENGISSHLPNILRRFFVKNLKKINVSKTSIKAIKDYEISGRIPERRKAIDLNKALRKKNS